MEVNSDFKPGSYTGDNPYVDLYTPDEMFGYAQESKPKLILMGLKRSGKSSIHKVVFHKMTPNETLFLESTTKPFKEVISSSSFIKFELREFPGQIDYTDTNSYDAGENFGGTGSLIYVIDSQEDYQEAIEKLGKSVAVVHNENPAMRFEVFIHKVDGLTDDQKIEVQRDIAAKVNDKIRFMNLEGKVTPSFYLTSIYDHSVFEACSRVVQKLISELSTLEGLLDIFIDSCRIDKAFLFDIVTKIYVATDHSHFDPQTYELCCDMIDVVLDVSSIYRKRDSTSESDNEPVSFIDDKTSATIKLSNNTVLYLREVNDCLALVSIMGSAQFEKRGLIDYNFHCFKSGIQKVFDLRARISEETASRDRHRYDSSNGLDSQEEAIDTALNSHDNVQDR